MAEQEVAKHVKKVYKIWHRSDLGFWHKAKEFLIEVVIIVFAVTLSIWLHDRSKHKQKEVTEFLSGLKSDLQNDLKEMSEDKAAFQKSSAAFAYISRLKYNEAISNDSLNKYTGNLFNSTGLIPNNGRFEGFKASGKIGNIENVELQNDIMDLYQENIPSLLTGSGVYNENKQKFFDYYENHFERTSDTSNNIESLFKMAPIHNMAIPLKNTEEIIARYDSCISTINKIIQEIDTEEKK